MEDKREMGVLQALPGPKGAGIRDMGSASVALRAFRQLCRVLFGAVFNVEAIGLENVPAGQAIICANHLGWADTFLALLYMPVEPRIYVLGERQVKELSGLRRWVIEALGIMVALDRGRPLEAVRTMKEALRRGGSLLIFPEGKLGSEEGRLCRLQQGAAHLSQASGVPLLPVGLTGTQELWLRRKLTLRIGLPLAPGDFKRDVRSNIYNMTVRLDTEMRALLRGAGVPPRVRLLGKWLTGLF